MVKIDERALKIVAGVKDKEVRRIFDDHYEVKEDTPAFVRQHSDALRALLPTYYDEMLRELDTVWKYLASLKLFLASYIYLEYKLVDPNDLQSVKVIGPSPFYCGNYRLVKFDSAFFQTGLDNGSFTASDVLAFVEENPEYLKYFLPILAGSNDATVWEQLDRTVQTAGLEDTLRFQVLYAMLTSKNADALRYFLDKIETNNYYRLKAMNEAAVSMGDYEATLPAKEVVAVLKDVVNDEREKYLSRSFRENYYFIRGLHRISKEKYEAYFKAVYERGTPRAKWAELRALTNSTEVKEYAPIIFSGELTLEDFSFFDYKFDARILDARLFPVVFEKLLALYDSMDKLNYHYKMDDDVPFARDVSKCILIKQLAIIAVEAKNAQYVAALDERYESMKDEAQAQYLSIIGNRTKLDRRACAIKFLKSDYFSAIRVYDDMKIVLTYDEAVTVSDYLKSKKERVKTKIIKEFLASPDKKKITEYLLQAKESYKIAVGQEMQASDGKIKTEKLKQPKDTRYVSFSQENVFTLQPPTEELNRVAAQSFPKFRGKSIGSGKLKELLQALEAFIEEHREYEYKPWIGEGMVTFGSDFQRLENTYQKRESFSQYPLGAELKAFLNARLTESETESLLILLRFADRAEKKFYTEVYGSGGIFNETGKLYDLIAPAKESYPYKVLSRLFLPMLNELVSEATRVEMALLFARPELLKTEPDRYYWDSMSYKNDFVFVDSLSDSDDTETLRAVAYIFCARAKQGAKVRFMLETGAKLFERGLLSKDLLRYFVLSECVSLYDLGSAKSPLCLTRTDYPYPAFKAFALELLQECVNGELSRGSLATPYSKIVCNVKKFYGAETFVRAIAALRGLTLVRSSYDFFSSTDKNQCISSILKYTVKTDDDTYEAFVALLQQYRIRREELVKATLFNPAFLDYAGEYLAIPFFKLAVYYFIAHLNDSMNYGEEELYERRIETIKEFSNINYLDFKDGAFDYEWYREMKEKVPEQDLKLIYDNAKYVTVGGLHKRAQRFFDAMNGKITKQECLEKITGTRNKDYCLIYSLIPLEGKEDLRERYLFLQNFLKESKSFGAQRQLSERRTVDIALENLARAAGYTDTNIFIFETEADNPHDIYRPFTVGDVVVTPEIAENGYQVRYSVTKNGKKLSAIPAKYGKNETVVWLKEEIKSLNQKFKRIIKSFEEAMCARVPFTVEQLAHMSRERTIERVLNGLCFLVGGKLAFFRDGVLTDPDGVVLGGGEVFIAHPVELKRLNALQDAINYVVQNNIKQPFKQVLREIYTKSEAELSQDEVLRFRGFNVDLKKCISALKGKGWGVSEDIGLRKVYYRANVVAALFRKFDDLFTFDFECVNRELHGIFFLNRKTEEIVPLKDVDEITFSETLRDVDLMITISANGVYDYDLAKSTVEIRHEILKSIVSILSLNNLSFLKDNISVKGYYGTYLINIRTGLVFKEGKGNLLLDTVYSTDKPLLLDFLDEDPMTADIISKAVVLANDQTIRDSAILREIKD